MNKDANDIKDEIWEDKLEIIDEKIENNLELDLKLIGVEVKLETEDAQKAQNESIPMNINLSMYVNVKSEFTDNNLIKNESTCDKPVDKTNHLSTICEKEIDGVYSNKYIDKDKKITANKSQPQAKPKIRNRSLKATPKKDKQPSASTPRKKKKNALPALKKCQSCDFKSRYPWNLEQHYLLTHEKDSKVELFKCAHCEYESKLKQYLKRHIFFVHKTDQVKNLKCNVCEFQAQNNWKLRRHVLKHTEPNLKCLQCSFKTRYQHCLDYHERNVHKSSSTR